MENQIDLRLELDEGNLRRDPFFLQNLEQDLQRAIQPRISHETRKRPEGTLSPEILVAIELAGVAVTALGTIWTILQIRYRGEISIEKVLPDGTKITIKKGNLTDAQLQQELEKLEQEARQNKFNKLIVKMTGS